MWFISQQGINDIDNDTEVVVDCAEDAEAFTYCLVPDGSNHTCSGSSSKQTRNKEYQEE